MKDSELNYVVRELRLLIGAAVKRYPSDDPNNAEKARILETIGNSLHSMAEKADATAKTGAYRVAFVGLTNVGKSTLLSALLGEEIAPRSNRPWSSAPVEYIYGNSLTVSVEYKDIVDRIQIPCSKLCQMHEKIVCYATEDGDYSQNGIKRLRATIPCDLLKDGLIIADTPGFGAAQVGKHDGDHHRSLREYLPRVNDIFWVISSEQGVTEIERLFFTEYLHKRCGDIVVNIFDEFSAKERSRFRGHNEKHIAPLLRWHFINARIALTAKLGKDNPTPGNDVTNSLETRFRQISTPEGRSILMQDDLLTLSENITHRISEYICNPDVFWPKTDWQAFAHAMNKASGDFASRILNAMTDK